MRSKRRLDPGLAVGLAGSLLFHVAAMGAVAMVRFDVVSAPILVELVELTAPAPVQPAKPAKAAPSAEPERAAPAVPEPPVVRDRAEPRVSVAISAAALPEHVIAPPVVRPASEEPPALPVSQDRRPRPVAAASARPERPAAERSEEAPVPALSADTVALPEKVERRPTLLTAAPTRTPEQPSLASAEPAAPPRPIVEPPVALGQVERSAEPHLTTLLSSRTPEMAGPVIPSVSSTPPPGAAKPTGALAGNQLLAALPRGGDSGAFIAPRLTAPRKPRYPEAARQAGIEGTVLVKAFVLADGSVREARVERSAGNAVLDSAALQTIRESRFIPAQRGGKPVPVWVEVPIDFRLER